MVHFTRAMIITFFGSLVSASVPARFNIETLSRGDKVIQTSGRFVQSYHLVAGQNYAAAVFGQDQGGSFHFNSTTGRIYIPPLDGHFYLDLCTKNCKGYEPMHVDVSGLGFSGFQLNSVNFIQVGSAKDGPQATDFKSFALCPQEQFEPGAMQLVSRHSNHKNPKCADVNLLAVK